MANVLSLALRVTADASGLKLDPVQRALVGLGDQADKLTKQFEQFTGGSEAAAKAQERFDQQAQGLINTLRDGGSATEFAAGFERLTEAVNKEAAAFERAARITEANLSPLERFGRAQAELNEQVNAGRISQETYERALAKSKAQLDGTADSANTADKNIESLTKNVRLLSVIEVGRAIIDGLQALSSVVSGTFNQISSFVSRISSAFDSFNDLSARTGIGVEALQGYSLAAKLAGVDTAAFGAAVQRLGVTIGKATPGDNLDKSLRAINLSVSQLRGLAPEQQFSAIGEAISGLPTAADRATAAVEIFGKQGAALAPLFREGAASIEELRDRAERLGIIVDETQISNIAEMNDAFDLARATVEGIAGQVIGNLAPAVTAVVDQFLEFIEAFKGAEGTGGTGIANAISKVLFDGAEALAGVFDSFVGQFQGFSVSLETAADLFNRTGQIFYGVFEGLRTVFNTFESAGNALLIGLGNILEGLGSWVSSDLEQAGRDLQASGQAAAERNSRELEQSAKNAANAFTNALTGGAGSSAAAGEGAASQFIQGVRQKFEQSQAPEFKIATNLETSGERLTAFIATVGEGAEKFYLDSVKTLEVFQQQAAAGNLTADQIEIMTAFSERLNGQLDIEIAKRKEAAEATAKQAEEDRKRIEELLRPSDALAKIDQDLTVIVREQARAQKELAAARAENDTTSANAAAARLSQLDQLQAKLDEQSQAIDQGFDDGFSAAFKKTAQSIDELIDKAAKFGNEGAKAAEKLQQGIALAQEQVRDGILTRDVYEAESARQRKLFEERLSQLETLRLRQKEQQDATFNQQIAANERVKALIGQQAQAEAEAAQKVIARRQDAAFNLQAIENQIALERQALDAAREQGDLKAARAGAQRLELLEKALLVEKEIFAGRQKDIDKQRQAAELQSRIQQQRAAQVQQYQQQQQQAAAQQAEAQRKVFEEQSRIAAAEAERQQKRIAALNSVSTQAVQGGDIRSQEGARQFISAAAGAFDPNLAELRAQSKLLRQIVLNSGALQYLEQGIGRSVTFLRGGA
jgi:hypothetical protein